MRSLPTLDTAPPASSHARRDSADLITKAREGSILPEGNSNMPILCYRRKSKRCFAFAVRHGAVGGRRERSFLSVYPADGTAIAYLM